MELSSYDSTIEQYLLNIVLTNTQAKRIDRELIALSELFAGAYEGDIEIYLQGSFATNTTVKPLTDSQTGHGAGEYDVDIVLERAAWGSATDSLKSIEDILKEDNDFAGKLSQNKKNSCVRLEYPPDPDTGVGFHVDLVPIKSDHESRFVALRDRNEWTVSDPVKLISWTKDTLAANPYMASQVLIVKRMRDLAGFNRLVPSIVILALMHDKYKDTGSYVGDLINFLETIDLLLSLGVEYVRIANPVNIRESIITEWENDSRVYEAVKNFFAESLEKLKQGFDNSDCTLIQEALSNDFPSELLPANVDSLRSNGITLSTSGELKRFAVNSSAPHGKRIRTNHWLFFERSKSIRFEFTYPYAASNILWQVCNSPGSEKLRGDLFKAKASGNSPPGSSDNEKVNNENELYLGTHWIRCFAMNHDNQVIATGSRVYVQVMKNSQPSYRR